MDRSVVKNKWVYRVKEKPDGSPYQYKARLVAKGFSQTAGVDYNETWAPVARFDSIRVLLSQVAASNLSIAQFDVTGAFLYGDLEEEIFMEEPEGFETSKDGSMVCRLSKSLYGLKQSPRQWNKRFDDFLKAAGLQETEADPCIYTNQKKDLFLALYVDDGLICAKDEHTISLLLTKLQSEFKVTVGDSSMFLGIQIERRKGTGAVFIHQEMYLKKVLERFGMSDCKPMSTPCSPHDKLQKPESNDEIVRDVPYREIVGSLMFLMVCTRPDIAYAVSALSQFLDCPTNAHWTAAKRVLRYLQGSKRVGICYFSGEPNLVAFSDADFAGDIETRQSRTGNIFVVNGGPVTWLSQRQKSVTLSTTEAEYIAACSAAKHVVWLRRLLSEFGMKQDSPTTLYCDNQSAINLVNNPKKHNRTKHVDVQFRFTREKQAGGIVSISYIPSDQQQADFLTKPLPRDRFLNNLSLLNMIA